MRIALVTPHAAEPGPGQRVTSLAHALARLGHNVIVHARKESAAPPALAEVAPGVMIEHVPWGPLAPLPAEEAAVHLRALSDHLASRWRRDPPDVAHALSWTAGLAALAAARGLEVPVVQSFDAIGLKGMSHPGRVRGAVPVATARGARRRPVAASRPLGTGRPVVTAPAAPAGPRRYGRAERSGPARQFARIRLELSLARNASAVLASSSHELGTLMSLGVPRTSLRLVPWGVDTGQFTPEGPIAPRGERARLLAVRHPGRHDGFATLLRALVEVPAADLLIADMPASARRGTGKMDAGLAALAGELGVAKRVTMAGEVSWLDLPALLRSADLLLSGAWDEPYGTFALEAMACGTPVAAPALGVCLDAVIDGTTGILVPPGQPAVLARRIRRLLAGPILLEALRIAAVDRARARYGWDRIGREMVRVYAHCLPTQFARADEERDVETAEDLVPELADSFQ